MAKRVRLTVHMREAILEKLITASFAPDRDAKKARQTALAVAVYNAVYSPAIQQAMSGFPEGYFRSQSSLDVRFGNEHDQVWFPEERRVAAMHNSRNRQSVPVFDDDHPVTKAFYENERLDDDFKEREDTAKIQAKAILFDCKTVEELIERWPEVEVFARPWLRTVPPPEAYPITFPMEDLNNLLRLKKA